MELLLETIKYTFGFMLLALAARQLGNYLTKIKLPYITGLLFTGMIAGPYILNLIPQEASLHLRFIEQLSLAFIAFLAGAELKINEFKDRLQSIKWVTVGLVIFTFIFCSSTFYFLSDWIPFAQSMSPKSRFGISLLAGAIMVARSPSSAIAVIKEFRAKGSFTQTVLGVTVIMDGIVIIIFSICSSLASALLVDTSINIGFLLLIVTELSIALLAGILVGIIINSMLSIEKFSSLAKGVLIILLGFCVFLLTDFIHHYTKDNFSFKLYFSPLLICMISGLYVANFTEQGEKFKKILHFISDPIYVAFFTLTGASMSLDILTQIWPIALILCYARIMGIFFGSFTGGVIAKDPMKFNNAWWMAYINQAGVALGLALDVSIDFPIWGNAFATTIISVIIINQIIGPPLFKMALFWTKEAVPPAKKSERQVIHNATIFGSDGEAIALAHQLHHHHWRIKLIAPNAGKIKNSDNLPYVVEDIPNLTINKLQKLEVEESGTVITMLSDDENLKICKLVKKHFENINIVVRLNDRDNAEKFKVLNALIVARSTAMVSLLDHFVRSPSMVSLLLGATEDNYDIIDIKVTRENLIGTQIHSLHLTPNLIIMALNRQGKMMDVKKNYRLKSGDLLTIAGPEDELNEITTLLFLN